MTESLGSQIVIGNVESFFIGEKKGRGLIGARAQHEEISGHPKFNSTFPVMTF